MIEPRIGELKAEGEGRSGVKCRMPVKDPVYGVIPLGVNEPNGWLRVQIDLLCDGLTGHVEDLYKDEVEGE